MVEFRSGVLLRKGYTPSIVQVWVKSHTILKLNFEYSCSSDTNMYSNVYLEMIDGNGDFPHKKIKLRANGPRKFDTAEMTVASGIVYGNELAVIRLWSEEEVVIKIKCLKIEVIEPGKLKVKKRKKWEYTTPLNYKVGIVRFHNLLHAKILSKQTKWDLIGYQIEMMKKYDFIIFLGPMLTRADKKLEKLIALKKIKPSVNIILWWIGSDIIKFLGGKRIADLESIKNLASRHICVSDRIKEELKSIDINADVITLIPKVEKYKVAPLPKKYTVGIYMPNRKDFFMYEDIIEVIRRTPEIKYIMYGNCSLEHNLSNLRNVGWVDSTEDVLKKCNCLLRLTVHDGFPQSIIEAILMGRCVITNQKYPCVKYAKSIDDVVNLIKEKPILSKECIDKYREDYSVSKLRYKLLKVTNAVKITVPHDFGENNGIATHINTLSKYCWNSVSSKDSEYDIINTHACGISKNVDVYTAHSCYNIEDYSDISPNTHVIRNANKAKKIICVSNYVKDFLVSNGVDKNKMIVIQNPLDLKEIDRIEPRKDLPKTFSLFIGNKNVKRAKLFIKLAKKYPKDDFVSIGCKHETPKNVIKINSVTREEALSITKACTIYLCLSKRESCPYVLLEAMAMRKKCIVSDFAGQKEIITDGVNGFTFKPDSIMSLCKVYKYAKSKIHRGIRMKARKSIEKKFDARVQAPKYDSAYVEPKVSIITYVYCTSSNHRLKRLRECIESVRSQNYDSYEHIIVDDGSTIRLEKQIIKMNDHHLKYYWKEHTGITHSTETYNYGLKIAQGKYILFLSSDDRHLKDTITVLSNYLDKHKNAIGVVGDAIHFTIKNGKIVSKINRETPIEDSIKDILLERNTVNGCAIMFRRSALKKIDLPPNNTGFASDYDLWIRLSEVGPIHRIKHYVVMYCRYFDSTRLKTVKNMDYRNERIGNVINSAKKRRGIK